MFRQLAQKCNAFLVKLLNKSLTPDTGSVSYICFSSQKSHVFPFVKHKVAKLAQKIVLAPQIWRLVMQMLFGPALVDTGGSAVVPFHLEERGRMHAVPILHCK